MMTNLEEYADPLLYEAEYGAYQSDFDFFLNLLDRGSVLDLACGTGRLTIPLAQKGLKVMGLDAAENMLTLARNKSKELSIQWIQGDMRDFHLNKTFDLIIVAGNAFQALVSEEDQRGALECIKQHLKPSGLFAFNTRNPQKSDFKTTFEFEVWHSFQDGQGEIVKVYGKQESGSSRQIVTYITKRVWKDKETITSLQLRFTSYQQLMQLLDQTGFEVCEIFGDDQKNPFHQNSPSILPVCRVKLNNSLYEKSVKGGQL
jgi:2-polyprenyl-3-methyl-5-hydroxy-6-metoxy-1,4-benzoquinol methylase